MNWSRLVPMVLCLFACRELGIVGGTPRERYEESLSRSGLSGSALGTQWLAAGRRALDAPVAVELPFRETGYFPAERAGAAGFEFTVERGQRLMIQLVADLALPGQLFLDLYSTVDRTSAPKHLISADSGETGVEVEIETSGTYLVRLQPELLDPARYTITIRSAPSLAFPVDGRGNEAIRSRYGVDRDGGRRRHEGIDIFAPRGTPVVAAARGRVVNVGENRLGGQVVWLHDPERNQNLYYAHLDRQLALAGQEVERGDTLGLVGNTGNARSTPPHLHFGIYRRGEGAIDPYPFVWRPPTALPALEADTAQLGGWIRTTANRILVGSDTLQRAAVMRVLAAGGRRYRVELPDGRSGFVESRVVQSAETPLERVSPGDGRLLERPTPGGILIDSLVPGARVGLLGRFGEYDLVETGGRVGWVKR